MSDDKCVSPLLPTCMMSNVMSSADWIKEASMLLKEPAVPNSVKRDVCQLWVSRLRETGIAPDSPFGQPSRQYTPEDKYVALADKEFDLEELLRLAQAYMVPSAKVTNVVEPARTRHGAPTSRTTYTYTPAEMYRHLGYTCYWLAGCFLIAHGDSRICAGWLSDSGSWGSTPCTWTCCKRSRMQTWTRRRR